MAKAKTGWRSCKLTLTITVDDQATEYTVRPIASVLHVRAYQVDKGDGNVYAVTQEASGTIGCDCGAAVFGDKVCKHGKALRVLGLLLTTHELLAMQRGTR